jgi:hypothetical protein
LPGCRLLLLGINWSLNRLKEAILLKRYYNKPGKLIGAGMDS